MTVLLRVFARLMYYPSLMYSDVMCALGLWRRWDWVDPFVLLGRVPARRDLRRLQSLGISTVINLCEEFEGHTNALEACGMRQLRLPTPDYSSPSEEDLLRGVDLLRQQASTGKKTYVHCKVGRGRSPTLILCYLMAERQVAAAEAFSVVRTARPQVSRNLARRPVVLAFERRIRGGGAGGPAAMSTG